MKANKKNEFYESENIKMYVNENKSINALIEKSWTKISPFWPLKNLIAVNPICGFEDLHFKDALNISKSYFQQKEIPKKMEDINRESIKWLQVFFDEGQSTIQMPNRNSGFLNSVFSLIVYDEKIHNNQKDKCDWLKSLPNNPEDVVRECLLYLGVNNQDSEEFLTLMLTTLPGWSGYVRYVGKWSDLSDYSNPKSTIHSEYLAFRILITCLIWPDAIELLNFHKKALESSDSNDFYKDLEKEEYLYQKDLIKKLDSISNEKIKNKPKAQLVFCIDVRSESFRRSLESKGNYETFGFAGFFGVPVSVQNSVTGDYHSSCPVLLKPSHNVVEKPHACENNLKNGYKKVQGIKKLYQSLKYTFVAPFNLVETIGFFSGIWMAIRNFSPIGSSSIKSYLRKKIQDDYELTPNIDSIPLEDQVNYGLGALKMMGLTENFSNIVLFCGHESTTKNNAYATSLDCGACGGRSGSPNAKIISSILNSSEVRVKIKSRGIDIPEDTVFFAANHNTTTDEVKIFNYESSNLHLDDIMSLKKDLKSARNENSLRRCIDLGVKTNIEDSHLQTEIRSKDWAQIRPEWGLAKNASFIIGPRWFSKGADLCGRSFLHSYEFEKDLDCSSLTTILTAPMVVAQWINCQYFFSSMDNIAYGGGSKVTKNITGKIGVMQGNASDLMNGLPLQSVFKDDKEQYHTPLRLTVVVYAPKSSIDKVIASNDILKKLFGNAWVLLICHDPIEHEKFIINSKLLWEKYK